MVKLNTDRELWRERESDYYADSIFVTESGSIGINCGGSVVVKPLREWFALTAAAEAGPELFKLPGGAAYWSDARHKEEIADTIERCAQVAETYGGHNVPLIAAAIRALKDHP